MPLAFLTFRALFTAPWVVGLLVGLIAPSAAIAVARERFGPFARTRLAIGFLMVDAAVLGLAAVARGDNPFSALIVELSPIGVIVAVITVLRRVKDIPPNICRVCGYDLRATPDRCPECGAAAGAAEQVNR